MSSSHSAGDYLQSGRRILSGETAAALPFRFGSTLAPRLLLGIVLSGCFSCAAALSAGLHPQASDQPAETLSGVIVDPSGALVPNASVTLTPSSAYGGSERTPVTTRSDAVGHYAVRVASGTYTLTVRAAGFADFQIGPVQVVPGSTDRFDVRLKMQTQLEQVDVLEEASDSRIANSVSLSREEIDQLPLDRAALLDQLLSLAGSPDAQVFVDGFSGAPLPPRSQIRGIRINQNPYSAQNDINPITGTIQVLTRPGTDRLHGDFYLSGDLSQLNAKNPFAPDQPPYYSFDTESTVSGSIRPNMSYVADYSERENRLNSLVDAQALAASAQPSPQTAPSPLSTISFSPRLDLQPAPHSTLNLRYELDRTQQTNGGVGQLTLLSEGFENTVFTHTLQVSSSQVLGEHAINDTRLQYIRRHTTQTPVSGAPAVIVEGVFAGGGSPLGALTDHLDKVELQNNVALAHQRHYLNFGGRVRGARDANRSFAGFSGEFIFSSLDDYQRTLAGTATAATQYIRTAGNAGAALTLADTALFAQDDWKATPSLTLSYGLRFEAESFVPDRMSLAPRAGFSLALGGRGSAKPPQYTLHGGAGVFYRRFPVDSALTVVRRNGVTEQQYIVSEPDFFNITPDTSALGPAAATSVYRISSRYRTPYGIIASLTLDRQLGRKGIVSLSWLNSRGVHTPLIENVNAPLPGTYNPSNPGSGTRPLGTSKNVYEFASDGVSRSSRISATLNLRPGRFSLYGYYTARFDSGDAEDGSFPSQPYRIGADYGRANDDIRHTMTVRGAVDLPRGFSVSGFLNAKSGAPFNIVLDSDLNGDTQFNDRPTFASDLSRPSVVPTPWGTLDTDPQPGQTVIPRNLGQGPAYVLLDLAVAKSFGLGRDQRLAPGSAATGRPGPVASRSHAATLDLWVESQNLLNHPNLAPPVGTLGSPLFGHSLAVVSPNSLSGDRIVDMILSVRF